MTINNGEIIINRQYRVRNLEKQLNRMSIQSILLLDDTDAFDFLRKKYNIVKLDEIDIVNGIDDYFKYIINISL